MNLDITPEEIEDAKENVTKERKELWSIVNNIIDFNRKLNTEVNSVADLENIPRKVAEIKQSVTKYNVDKKNNAEYLVSLFNGTVKHIDELVLDILKKL